MHQLDHERRLHQLNPQEVHQPNNQMLEVILRNQIREETMQVHDQLLHQQLEIRQIQEHRQQRQEQHQRLQEQPLQHREWLRQKHVRVQDCLSLMLVQFEKEHSKSDSKIDPQLLLKEALEQLPPLQQEVAVVEEIKTNLSFNTF